jgi:hypothetical protein
MRKTFRKYCALGIAALAIGFLSAPASAHLCDFITGGGFGTTEHGSRANFGAHGGCKKSGPDAPFWGHVNYVDHFAGFSPSPAHFRSLTIDAYQEVETRGTEKDPKRMGTRRICGTGTTNQPTAPLVDFRVEMTDNGEPGTGRDRFEITLGVGGTVRYHASFILEGGNIQLHKPNPSTTGSGFGGECKI